MNCRSAFVANETLATCIPLPPSPPHPSHLPPSPTSLSPPPHPSPPQSTPAGNQTETMATVSTPLHSDLEWNPAATIGIGAGLAMLILVAMAIITVTTGCIYHKKGRRSTEKRKRRERREGREGVTLLQVVVPSLPPQISPSSSPEQILSNGENRQSSLSHPSCQHNRVSSQLPQLQIHSDSVGQGCDSKTVSCDSSTTFRSQLQNSHMTAVDDHVTSEQPRAAINSTSSRLMPRGHMTSVKSRASHMKSFSTRNSTSRSLSNKSFSHGHIGWVGPPAVKLQGCAKK